MIARLVATPEACRRPGGRASLGRCVRMLVGVPLAPTRPSRAGTQESMRQAIGATRPGGFVSYVGMPHGMMLDGQSLFLRRPSAWRPRAGAALPPEPHRSCVESEGRSRQGLRPDAALEQVAGLPSDGGLPKTAGDRGRTGDVQLGNLGISRWRSLFARAGSGWCGRNRRPSGVTIRTYRLRTRPSATDDSDTRRSAYRRVCNQGATNGGAE
jgi:hypothetical protein